MHGIVYCAELLDARRYYGQTIKTLGERKSEHEYAALRGIRCSYFQRALKRHGFDSFIWNVVETCDKTMLGESESFYILRDRTIEEGKGFNLCLGGDVPRRYRLTVEHKQKIANAQRGKFRKKHSNETKSKMSASHKGKKFSESHLEAMRVANLGSKNPMFGRRYKMSDETREKMRQAALKQWTAKRK